MSIAQTLLTEFDAEMANTRRTLERVPEDKLSWKPDPKSMSMGRLAGHVAEMPSWGMMTMTSDELDLDPEGTGKFDALVATSREQLLAAFDKNVTGTREAIAAAADDDFMKMWSLKVHGQTMMSMPRLGVIRTLVMNHTIHHRGQLTVYYRLTGVPVPALYGPSADEGSMAVAASETAG